MPFKMLMLLLLCLSVACSVQKLGKELERADSTYGYVKFVAQGAQVGSSNILVALYLGAQGAESAQENVRLVDVRTAAAGEAAIFMVPGGANVLVAFADTNGDFIHQMGEPAALTSDVRLSFAADMGDTNYSLEALPVQQLQLDTGTVIGFPVDLTERSLARQLERANNNFLVVTSWDDPKFSADTIKQGLWEPLTFEEQVGYGLYLLEAPDFAKQPVVFVHGINASPTNFRTLVQNLGEQYQPIFFHYPSGFPLDHSAYILSSALNELVARYPISKLSVVAHSMGGLLSRGAIVKAAPATKAKLHRLVTLSTPWLGHQAASLGVKWAPAVAPVWRSMVPNSDYQQQIFANPLPVHTRHHLYFSFSRQSDGPSAADDGVVTVKSQLGYQAQQEASVVRGIAESHNGILSSACVAGWVAAALATDASIVEREVVTVGQGC